MKYIIIGIACLSLLIVTWFIALDQPVIGDNIGNAVLDILECVIHYKTRIRHLSSSSNPKINEFYGRVDEELRKTIVYEGCKRNQFMLVGRGILSCVHNTHFPWYWEYCRPSTSAFWEKHQDGFRTAMVNVCSPMKFIPLDTAIHMRLGDAPFLQLYNSCSQYHFQYGVYYQWAFNRLNLQQGDPITIVYSITWQSNDHIKKLSEQFMSLFSQWVTNQGYQVSLQSEDSLTDLASLVNSRRFIGSCGSYSFIAGIGRDSSTFCLPQSGKEFKHGRYTLYNRPEWMSPYPPLLHNTVRNLHMDYNDINALANLLFPDLE